jgi:hypothetical protein
MRKSIPLHIQTDLLLHSRRRCAICFGIKHDTTEKHGQIAHLDQDNENADFENLVWLCLDHHDQYDSQTSQSKNFTHAEVKKYREQLYEFIRKQNENTEHHTGKSNNQEKAFLVGKQLKELRDEIGVSTSEFIELVGFHSEKLYRQMENDEIECNESVINEIAYATGVLSGWIKHRDHRKCEVDFLSFRPYDKNRAFESAQQIIQCSSGLIYLTISASTPKSDLPPIRQLKNLWAQAQDKFLHIGVCVPITKFKYRIFDTHISLGVRDPEMSGFYMPTYVFLNTLWERYWVDAHGIIISNWKDEEDLYHGRVHPEKIIAKHYYKNDVDWLHAILDFDHKHAWLGNFNSAGNWLPEMQAKLKQFSIQAL